MNYKDLKRAKIGDRVAFKPLPDDAGSYAEGTITDFSPSKNKCTVLWDDGERGIVTDASYDRIHLMQMELPLTENDNPLAQLTDDELDALRQFAAYCKRKRKDWKTELAMTYWPNARI